MLLTPLAAFKPLIAAVLLIDWSVPAILIAPNEPTNVCAFAVNAPATRKINACLNTMQRCCAF